MDARNAHPLIGLKDAVRAGEGLGIGTGRRRRPGCRSDGPGEREPVADVEVRTV